MHMLADRAAVKLEAPQVARLARTTVRSAQRAMLAIARGPAAPALRRVGLACRHDGAPLIVLHEPVPGGTKAAVAIEGRGGRVLVTVQGTLKPWRDELDRSRFERRNPHEHLDDCCQLHVIEVAAVTVESEGHERSVAAGDYLFDASAAAPLKAAEPGIIEHINGGHPDAIYAVTSHRALGAEGWIVTGVDPEGIDIALDNSAERIVFERPVQSREDVKHTMIALRTAAGSPPPATAKGAPARAAE